MTSSNDPSNDLQGTSGAPTQMREQLVRTILGVVERGILFALRDAEFRAAVYRLAQAVVKEPALWVSEDDGAAGSRPEQLAIATGNPVDALRKNGVDSSTGKQPEKEEEKNEPLPELTLGRAVSAPLASATPSMPSRAEPIDTDLSLLEARCRLKAEGSRWAATRRRLISEGVTFLTEIAPRDQEIIESAKEINCFLWMCTPSAPSPENPNQYETLAACFDAVADALAVLKQITLEPDLYSGEFEQTLDLLAEAQSALRMAVIAIDGPTDSDQALVFRWLRQTASENQILIHRFMRLDEPADPAESANLTGRIEILESQVQEIRRREKSRRKLLGKVRHKTSLLAKNPNDDQEWSILIATVEELVKDGVPASNRELRELLLPVIDDLPELPSLPSEFQVVLREIDRFLATCAPVENPPFVQRSVEAQEIARLLDGRSMVLIGGERRPEGYRAIKEAFGLKELYWIEGKEHRSTSDFEPYIAKPDVAVVLLAIRWSSHSFGNVRDYCAQHNKPFVRLPGGYNPNQVAAQIMAQASGRLRDGQHEQS